MVSLTLVLVAGTRPAEGFTFYEQREALSPPFPQLQPEGHQAVVDLCGAWDYRVGEKGPFRPGWIPGCYEGTDAIVTLQRTFTLADSLRSLHFQLFLPEIHYGVEVWLNGTLISSFTGSHLGFTCDLARDRLRFGSTNEIMLRVDSRLTPRSTLPVRSQVLQPRNFGGVFSGAYLRGVPAWSVEDVGLVSEAQSDSNAVRASVRIRIAQYRAVSLRADSVPPATDIRVYAALKDSTGRVIAEGWSDRMDRGSSENFQATVSLPKIAVSFWSPARPTQYRLSAAVMSGSDTIHTMTRKVGFKDVEVKFGDLYLNGQRLRLRGVDYVPEQYRGGRATSPSLLRQDLTRIKDLGMNVIRVPFGPPPPELVNIADELGLLVLAESGLDWIPGEVLEKSSYRDLVKQSVQRLQMTFRDHPSVLAWGLGSQLDWRDPATHEFSAWLLHVAKEQDNRLCYVEGTNSGELGGLADFILAAQRPDGRMPVVDATGQSPTPVVMSRIGQLAALGNTGYGISSSGIVNQAEFLIRQILAAESNQAADGFLIHAFSDYHGASPLLVQPNRSDPYLYSFGIIGFDRDERIAYAKLRDLAQTGQSSPQVPSESDKQPPVAFPVAGLAALLILSIELRRNNVFRQNLKRAFLHSHGFYSDLRYRRFLHTAQPLLLWFVESITLALLVASAFYAMRTSFALDYYLTHFLPWPHAKSWLVNLIWDPIRSVVYLTALFMALIVLKTIFVRVVSMLFRERVDFWQSANYVIWSFAALLYLLPVAAVFYRAVEIPAFSKLVLLGVTVGLVWSFLRLMTALRTGFGTTTVRLYSTVVVTGAVFVVVILMILDSRFGTLTYLPYFHDAFAR
jgi:hypothetical protein